MNSKNSSNGKDKINVAGAQLRKIGDKFQKKMDNNRAIGLSASSMSKSSTSGSGRGTMGMSSSINSGFGKSGTTSSKSSSYLSSTSKNKTKK